MFRPNKKICLFTVSWPTLYLIADPNCFYPSLEIRKSHVGTFNFYIHLNRSSVWNRNRKWKKKQGDYIYVHMFSAVWRMRTHKANAVNIGIYPGVRSITWGKWKGSRFWSTRQTTWRQDSFDHRSRRFYQFLENKWETGKILPVSFVSVATGWQRVF